MLPSDESDVSVGEVDSAIFLGPERAMTGMETSSNLLRLGKDFALSPSRSLPRSEEFAIAVVWRLPDRVELL